MIGSKIRLNILIRRLTIMARPKTRDYKSINFNLDVKVLEKLERYCEETGRTKTTAIERILDKFLTEYFAKQSEEE